MSGSNPRSRICLISPSHPASNPRLVKEATALAQAGYDVRVVALRTFPPLDALDAEILRAAPGRWTVVDFTGGVRATVSKLRRQRWRHALEQGARMSTSRAALAWHAAIPRLARIAASERADLYIGHTLGGLAAAGMAAANTRSRFGFDAEDFHSGETLHVETHPLDARLVGTLEEHWLPRCTHLTAASPAIADAYRARYGIRRPVPVLNVFPLAERPTDGGKHSDGDEIKTLYWFSQTIGPDRGLEPLLAVLGRIHHRVSLHLRGNPAGGQMERLRRIAKEHRFGGELRFLPWASASEMARLAASYDLGLSLEQSPPRNRDLCLTNKIFTYLLAGIPVALTPTLAQRQVANDLGGAALLIDLANPVAAAATLDAFFADPSRQSAARATARRLAKEHYNWDLEQQHLLASVRTTLGQSPMSLPE